MSAKLEVDVVAKIKDFKKGVDEAGKSVDNLGNKTDSANKKATQSTKVLNEAIAGMKQGFNDAISSVVPFSGQIAKVGSLMGGVIGGAKGSASAFKLFRTALMSTGIGAIVVVLGSLVSYLTTTQSGMDKLRQVTEPVAQIFQRLLGVLQNLGGNVFKGIAQMLNGEIKEGFKTLAEGAKQAGKETVNAFKNGIEAGGQLADLTVQIEEAQNAMILSQARLNREIANQQEIAMDANRTESERQKAAKKAIDLIAQREENEARAATERRRLNNIANKGITSDLKEEINNQLKEQQGYIDKIGNILMPKETGVLDLQLDIAMPFNENDVAILKEAETTLGLYNDQLTRNFENILPFGDLLSQTFAGIAETGKLSFQTLVQGLKKMLVQLAATVAAAFALNLLLGGIGVKGFAKGAGGFKKILGGLGGGGPLGGLIPFANGGIVSGPTSALVGEYTGARTNPEVIAPLSKLQNMMGGNVTFTISGDNLVGTLNRANKTRSRKF